MAINRELARRELYEKLENLKDLSSEYLIRKDLSELSFEDVGDEIEHTLKLFNEFSECDYNRLPIEKIIPITQLAQKVLNNYKEIEEFSVSNLGAEFEKHRNSLIREARQHYLDTYSVLATPISYLKSTSSQIDSILETAKQEIATLKNSRRNAGELLSEFQEELTKMSEAAKAALSETTVSKYAVYFKNEATKSKNSAWAWIIITWLLTLISIGAAFLVIFLYIKGFFEPAQRYLIQIGVAKIAIFSMLYYSIIWSSRNYRAQRHNYVTNKHRQNALSTFQAFADNAKDDVTQNAILLRSTEAIFSVGSSGYIQSESESHSSPQILEILRNFVGNPQ